MLRDEEVVGCWARQCGRASTGEGQPGRTEVVAERVALEKMRRVEGRAECGLQLPLRAILWHARHLGFTQVRAHRWPTGEQHQLPPSHPLPPRVDPRLVYHPRDCHVVLACK